MELGASLEPPKRKILYIGIAIKKKIAYQNKDKQIKKIKKEKNRILLLPLTVLLNFYFISFPKTFIFCILSFQ